MPDTFSNLLKVRPDAKRMKKPMQTCKYCGRKHYIFVAGHGPIWAMVSTGGYGGKYEDVCPRCVIKCVPQLAGKKRR